MDTDIEQENRRTGEQGQAGPMQVRCRWCGKLLGSGEYPANAKPDCGCKNRQKLADRIAIHADIMAQLSRAYVDQIYFNGRMAEYYEMGVEDGHVVFLRRQAAKGRAEVAGVCYRVKYEAVWLTACRERAQLTHAQLADRLGVMRQRVTQLEDVRHAVQCHEFTAEQYAVLVEIGLFQQEKTRGNV